MCVVLARRPLTTHHGHLLVVILFARALFEPIYTGDGNLTHGDVSEPVRDEVEVPVLASLPARSFTTPAEVKLKFPVLVPFWPRIQPPKEVVPRHDQECHLDPLFHGASLLHLVLPSPHHS